MHGLSSQFQIVSGYLLLWWSQRRMRNGEYVDYRELNKDSRKYHFHFPFIIQVLGTLFGKHYFSFLDGFSGYNQVQIHPTHQDKNSFTCPWGTFSYNVFQFGLCNAPATFQRVVFNIFSYFLHDKMEIYMDDFTPYGDTIEKGLLNLEKVL